VTYRKKLIEVALPLDAINDASAYDKMPGIGPHPKGIHKWWAPLPLPAARAVLFASLVDDPSGHPDQFPTPAEQEAERGRLFRILRELVEKGAEKRPEAFRAATSEIRRHCGSEVPILVDPFCGSGAIPLEAQRLSLEVRASDLNPIAVLITKALIEIPPNFDKQPPVNPKARVGLGHSAAWTRAQGLAEDVRYYGRWMWEQAKQRLEHLYPKVVLPRELGGAESTAIAWLWARTVKCPNPACGAPMPLVSSFALSKKKKGRSSWIEALPEGPGRPVRFDVRTGEGTPPTPPKIGRGAKFRCLTCGQVADEQHIKDEGKGQRIGRQLIAIVADSKRGRLYLPPDEEHAAVAERAMPAWRPEQPLADDPRNIWCVNYGVETVADIFSPRQLVALATLSDLVGEARNEILKDAAAAGLPDNGVPLREGGTGGRAYAEAVGTYLAFAVDRAADFNNSLCRWVPSNEKVMNLFGRQAIPMVWDYAEANVLADSVGGFGTCSDYVSACLQTVQVASNQPGVVRQLDAAAATPADPSFMVSTDPPYYDNIAYSDLSDFFYVWIRRTLADSFPDLFATLLTPKNEELVATPYRFGGDKRRAKAHFESGFRHSFDLAKLGMDARFPMTLYYAFKQSEAEDSRATEQDRLSLTTGWETMLEALVSTGFQVTGTWPVRASQAWRMISMGTNALASYIVLACRPRPERAPLATRREFVGALRGELPEALRTLQHGNVAPVDLAQAAIGPGMAVFSRYEKVLEADGGPMRIRTALGLINQAVDEILTAQESEYDPSTRWAIAWFEQFGTTEGPYGVAETLSKAKNTSVESLKSDGFLYSRGGKVRLLRRDELPDEWNPLAERTLSIWELTQHLIKQLEEHGELGAASIFQRVGSLGETARNLAYRLYTTCERRGWAQEALAYNSIVVSWPEIARLAVEASGTQERLI
jgi:putative DNA methylase